MRFDTDGRPQVVHVQPTKPEDWGFDASALQAADRVIDWHDMELLDFLTYGGYNYSASTLPVSWFAPHILLVYMHWDAFPDSVHKEIGLAWMKWSWTLFLRSHAGRAGSSPPQAPTAYRIQDHMGCLHSEAVN